VRVWGKFDNSNLPYSAKEDWTIQICHTALNTQSFYLGNITIQDYTTSLSIVAIYTQEWRSCFRYCARRYGSSSVELLCVKWFGNAHTASTTSLARTNGICSSVSTLRRARCQKLTLWALPDLVQFEASHPIQLTPQYLFAMRRMLPTSN